MYCDETPEERAERVLRLKRQYEAGEYRPDSAAIAEAFSAGAMVDRAFSQEQIQTDREALREYLAREQAQVYMGETLRRFTLSVGQSMALQFLRDWIAIVETNGAEEN